ncbi:FAD-dependent oxidoreductase [Paracoccaceae bacterium Fryx2]|nr:FAD-dependent oxidoreductase [Paracoccaceae bacterium Fryx2]
MTPAPIILRRALPRVCIIGGGIVGSATAFFLARGGCPVELLERDTVGSRASGVNFGGVRRHGRAVAELPLAIRSRAIWPRLRELIGHDCDFETPGHLKVAQTEAELEPLARWAAIGRAHGLTIDLLDRGQLRRDHPWLTHDLAGGSFCPGDGYANPRLVAPYFARAARAEGAVIREGHPVLAVEDTAGGGFVLHGPLGARHEADVVVNAAGAWGGAIAGQLGLDVPMVSLAPQMFVTEPTTRRIGPVLGMVSGAIYLRQSVRGNVIFGGGRGSVHPDGLRSRPAEDVFERSPALVRALIPALAGVPLIRSWTGIEGNTPDGLPVIGESGGRAGLIHACGFSGHGFEMGPGVGETLRDLILTGDAGLDLSAFSPDRFAVPPAIRSA